MYYASHDKNYKIGRIEMLRTTYANGGLQQKDPYKFLISDFQEICGFVEYLIYYLNDNDFSLCVWWEWNTMFEHFLTCQNSYIGTY